MNRTIEIRLAIGGSLGNPSDPVSFDNVSVLQDGVELISNGNFELEPGRSGIPPSWLGNAGVVRADEGENVYAGNLSGAIRSIPASGPSYMYQQIQVDDTKNSTISVAMRGSPGSNHKADLYVILKDEGLGHDMSRLVGRDPWAPGVFPYRENITGEWVAISEPLWEQEIPEILVVQSTVERFIPGGDGATLAIAGLAVAGLSRAGFYPKQTDDIVAPPADPPVFDGGIYAYHKDEEGKE